MKTTQALAIILVSFVLMLSSCGKYDDGPWFSIYSKKERATGLWWFEKVVVDGVNLTEDYSRQSLEIYRSGTILWTQGYVNNNPYDPILLEGTWSFSDDQDNLSMVFKPYAAPEIRYNWTIKRLAYGEMWLDITNESGKTQWRLLKR
jgi:hypothetical protein